MPTAGPSITFKPTLRDVRGRFTKATNKLVAGQRRAVRVLARRWVAIARQEAPVGKGRTSKNRTHGTFRKSIAYKEFTKKGEVGFESVSEQPLGMFIVHGTRPHRIRARRAKALYFFWGRIGKYVVVPKAGGNTYESDGKLFIGKGYVKHPGTKPNNYTGRAYVRWVKELDKEIMAVADRFVIDLVGKK